MTFAFPERINDNWLSRVMARLGLTYLSVAAIWAVFSILRDFALAYAFGIMTPSSTNVGLLANPVALFHDCVLHSVILAYFCWIQTNGLNVFRSLLAKGIIVPDVETQGRLAKCVNKLRSRRISRLAPAIALVIVAWWYLSTYYLMPPQNTHLNWYTVDRWIGLLDAPALYVVAYALTMLAWNGLVIVLAVNEIFENRDIRVDVLNPDRAGGLGSIGKFSGDFTYLFAALGISYSIGAIASQGQFAGEVPSIPGVIAYMVLAPFVFFAPLWTAHKKMVKYRDSTLQGLAVEFGQALTELRKVTNPCHEDVHSQEEVDIAFKNAKQIHDMRDLVMQFPTWPFNNTSFRKFFGLVYATVIPALISLAIDKIK